MNKVRLYFGFFMVILYFITGIYSLTINIDRISINHTLFRLFGVLLLLYGIFRGYRAYQDYKNSEIEENDEE